MSVTIENGLVIVLEEKECNRLLQTPSGTYRPLQLMGVGRTVEINQEIWLIVEQDPEGSRTKLKSLTGKVGRPKMDWVWNQTLVEE